MERTLAKDFFGIFRICIWHFGSSPDLLGTTIYYSDRIPPVTSCRAVCLFITYANSRMRSVSSKNWPICAKKRKNSRRNLMLPCKKAKEDAMRETRKEEQIKADLLKEKYDGERRIAALTIDTLKERVSALETEADALKKALTTATQEV